MNIDTLSKQGRGQIHTGLAGIDSAKLKAMRNTSLRECFGRMSDISCRLETVARIRGQEFVNDAASRNVNSTWYSLESLEGNIIWIACADNVSDYNRLQQSVKRKVFKIFATGNTSRLRQALAPTGVSIEDCSSLKEAVGRAHYCECPDTAKVLFSPATGNGLPTGVLAEEFRYAVNEL
ncbi:MAG: hypothetical protein K5650_03680 [Bacteroidales bacterium]|nr:hypothetical protein [Bacteroidales bacterium]